MPRIDPAEAPINRRRLILCKRVSKKITAAANSRPAAAPASFEILKGRKWYPTTTQTETNTILSASISQKEPCLSWGGRAIAAGRGNWSKFAPAELRPGAFDGFAMVAPYETYENMSQLGPNHSRCRLYEIKPLAPDINRNRV